MLIVFSFFYQALLILGWISSKFCVDKKHKNREQNKGLESGVFQANGAVCIRILQKKCDNYNREMRLVGRHLVLWINNNHSCVSNTKAMG